MFQTTFRRIFGGLALTFLGGCGGDPYDSMYTKVKPLTEDIVGLWSLDGDASYPRRDSVTKKSSIQFLTDGSFVATDIPKAWWEDGRDAVGFESVSGSWAIDQSHGSWEVLLDFQKVNGAKSDRTSFMNFVGKAPSYQLYARVCDPDQADVLVFQRSMAEVPKKIP